MTTENSKNCTGVLIETEAWVRGDLGSTYVSSAIDCRLNSQNGDFLFEIHQDDRDLPWVFIDEGSYEDWKLKSVTKRKFWNFEEEIKRVKYG